MNPAADRIQDAARFDQTISALASGRRPARRRRAVVCADIAQDVGNEARAASPAVEAYIRARTAYEQEAEAYWQSIADKRRARFAKRRSGEAIVLDDYVLTQPPVYTGPPRPPGYVPPHRDPERPPVPIPTIPEFLTAADRAIQLRAGPPEDRTGVQAGLRQGRGGGRPHHASRRCASMRSRPAATATTTRRRGDRRQARTPGRSRPRSATTSLLSHQLGEPARRARRQVPRPALSSSAAALVAADRKAMDRKIAALQKMIAFSRTRAERLERARQARQDHARAAWASTPRCSTATSARCCRPRSCSTRCCSPR